MRSEGTGKRESEEAGERRSGEAKKRRSVGGFLKEAPKPPRTFPENYLAEDLRWCPDLWFPCCIGWWLGFWVLQNRLSRFCCGF